MARRFAGILSGCGDEEVTRVFKNSEGYADPTAGAALAHIADEERRKAKEAHRLIQAARRNERGGVRKRNQRRWVKVWPKNEGRIGGDSK